MQVRNLVLAVFVVVVNGHGQLLCPLPRQYRESKPDGNSWTNWVGPAGHGFVNSASASGKGFTKLTIPQHTEVALVTSSQPCSAHALLSGLFLQVASEVQVTTEHSWTHMAYAVTLPQASSSRLQTSTDPQNLGGPL